MSEDVLADLDVLRRRARGDRHAYAFPLFLFGALILLAPLLYVSAPLPPGEFVQVDTGPFPQFTFGFFLRYPDLVGWYWVLTIVGGLWLTGWWYRHRARQRGVETDIHVTTVAAGAALLGFLVWQPVFATLLADVFHHYGGLYSSPALNLPVLFGSAALAAVAGLWSRRRTGWARSAGVACAAFLATVAFGALGVYLISGYAALVIIAAALLMLAWAERSVLLTIVGVVFAGVALLVNLYDVQNVFYRLGWTGGWDSRVTALQTVLLPGVVLLVGGVVAVIGRRR